MGFVTALWLLSYAPAYGVPMQYTHQGRLTDASGEPLEDDLEMTFRLIDAESDGSVVWEEVLAVSLNNGFYSTVLGSDLEGNPLDLEVLDQWPLWLEIQVGEGSPMSPRQPLHSVPYAALSGVAEELRGGPVDASSIAVGGVEVVGEDGSWVGPEIGVSWDDLAGIPDAYLDETDSDALADLSCLDGDVARWDGLLGEWACDLDEDSLSSLACADGEVATWSEADVQWTCGSLVELSLIHI